MINYDSEQCFSEDDNFKYLGKRNLPQFSPGNSQSSDFSLEEALELGRHLKRLKLDSDPEENKNLMSFDSCGYREAVQKVLENFFVANKSSDFIDPREYYERMNKVLAEAHMERSKRLLKSDSDATVQTGNETLLTKEDEAATLENYRLNNTILRETYINRIAGRMWLE